MMKLKLYDKPIWFPYQYSPYLISLETICNICVMMQFGFHINIHRTKCFFVLSISQNNQKYKCYDANHVFLVSGPKGTDCKYEDGVKGSALVQNKS